MNERYKRSPAYKRELRRQKTRRAAETPEQRVRRLAYHSEYSRVYNQERWKKLPPVQISAESAVGQFLQRRKGA